ncbi:MAG: sulfotransferase domain-containing protein [Mariniblastus sp.]
MNNKRFFCLRGFMKSGTNWLGSLLSSHEEISVVGEFHWHTIVSAFNENQNTLAIFQDADVQERARKHLEEMIRQNLIDHSESNATVIGERTPHTLVPVTMRAVPHISIIRDGRDVLVSRAFHLYNSPEVTGLFDRFPEMAAQLESFQADPWFFHKNPELLLSNDVMVKDSIRWWVKHLESDEQTVKLYPKLPVRFIKYEDLHRDTQTERAGLFEFLDVDPNRAAKIEGHLKPGFKEERPAEFLRKGVVGDWKNYFSDQTKEWFKEVGGEKLMQYGYTQSMDW